MRKINFLICNLIILVLLVVVCDCCFGQSETPPADKSRHSHISFAFGFGVPVGEFTEYEKIKPPDKFDHITGPAEIGFGGNLGFGYLFGKHFGIAASLYGSSFAGEQIEPHEMIDSPQPQGRGESVHESRWNATGMLLGGMYEYSKNKFRFGLKLLVGVQMAFCPETNITIVKPLNAGKVDWYSISEMYQPAMNAIDLAYGGGMQLGYILNERLSLNFALDYTSANHRFTGKDLETHSFDTYVIASGNHMNYKSPINYEQQVSFVSITFGIMRHF